LPLLHGDPLPPIFNSSHTKRKHKSRKNREITYTEKYKQKFQFRPKQSFQKETQESSQRTPSISKLTNTEHFKSLKSSQKTPSICKLTDFEKIKSLKSRKTRNYSSRENLNLIENAFTQANLIQSSESKSLRENINLNHEIIKNNFSQQSENFERAKTGKQQLYTFKHKFKEHQTYQANFDSAKVTNSTKFGTDPNSARIYFQKSESYHENQEKIEDRFAINRESLSAPMVQYQNFVYSNSEFM